MICYSENPWWPNWWGMNITESKINVADAKMGIFGWRKKSSELLPANTLIKRNFVVYLHKIDDSRLLVYNVCVYWRIFAYTRVCACVFTYTYWRILACTRVCMCVFTYTCLHTHSLRSCVCASFVCKVFFEFTKGDFPILIRVHRRDCFRNFRFIGSETNIVQSSLVQ